MASLHFSHFYPLVNVLLGPGNKWNFDCLVSFADLSVDYYFCVRRFFVIVTKTVVVITSAVQRSAVQRGLRPRLIAFSLTNLQKLEKGKRKKDFKEMDSFFVISRWIWMSQLGKQVWWKINEVRRDRSKTKSVKQEKNCKKSNNVFCEFAEKTCQIKAGKDIWMKLEKCL